MQHVNYTHQANMGWEGAETVEKGLEGGAPSSPDRSKTISNLAIEHIMYKQIDKSKGNGLVVLIPVSNTTRGLVLGEMA